MADWAIMVIAIVAITTFGRIYAAKNGIRYRGKKSSYEPVQIDDRRIELVVAENEKLKGSLLRLEERVAVLEKIAIDPGARLAKEIDALR